MKNYVQEIGNNFAIFEVVKETAKTLTVADSCKMYDWRGENKRVKKSDYKPFDAEYLMRKNMKTASVILNLDNPEWGSKKFNYDPSGRGHHSFGSGCNSAVLFESNFGNWVVLSYHDDEYLRKNR